MLELQFEHVCDSSNVGKCRRNVKEHRPGTFFTRTYTSVTDSIQLDGPAIIKKLIFNQLITRPQFGNHLPKKVDCKSAHNVICSKFEIL